MHLHPGEHIKDELKERGWTQATLAEVMGRPTQFISQLVNGKKSVTVRTAKELALAFDSSAHMWLQFQNGYDLDHPKPKRKKRETTSYTFNYNPKTLRWTDENGKYVGDRKQKCLDLACGLKPMKFEGKE